MKGETIDRVLRNTTFYCVQPEGRDVDVKYIATHTVSRYVLFSRWAKAHDGKHHVHCIVGLSHGIFSAERSRDEAVRDCREEILDYFRKIWPDRRVYEGEKRV